MSAFFAPLSPFLTNAVADSGLGHHGGFGARRSRPAVPILAASSSPGTRWYPFQFAKLAEVERYEDEFATQVAEHQKRKGGEVPAHASNTTPAKQMMTRKKPDVDHP